MSTRNRVIYQSEAVFVTQGAYDHNLCQKATVDSNTNIPSGVTDLQRVQSANYSFSISRQDVNQFGELARIDSIITDTPTVSFDTSYILANFCNEKKLGFEITPSGAAISNATSCISGLINSDTTAYQKNYFILTSKEGSDAVDVKLANPTNANLKYESIIGIGNGFMTSYSSEAAVGGLPTVSGSVEGMNMNFVNVPYSGYIAGPPATTFGFEKGTVNGVANTLTAISGANPAINPADGTKVGNDTDGASAGFVCLPIPTGDASGAGGGLISALRPGDITLSLMKKTSDAITDSMMNASTSAGLLAGADVADAHIQSYTLSFDMSRTPIQKLGTKFAFARPVDFPITTSLSVDAILADLTTGNIADIINCDDEYDAVIKMKDPDCHIASTSRKDAVAYLVRGLKIDSESFSSSIGDNKTVTLDFSSQIGGPEQKGVGIFMSGYGGDWVATQ